MWESIGTWITQTGVKILIAFIILIVAFAIINKLVKLWTEKAAKKAKLDKTLSKTLANIAGGVTKGLVIVALIGYLGIDTSGIAALIASLGVAVGLAVNGTLSNFAGGVLLLITRPFKVDDYISVAGEEGTVEDLKVVSTKLVTLDNKVVYIPNSVVSTSTIVNFTEKGIRRVDLSFTIGNDFDYTKAQEAIMKVMKAHDKVLEEPAPFVRILTHGKTGVEFTMRAWVKCEDYWDVYFDKLEGVKKAFLDLGVTVPHEQLDVHMK